MNNISKTSYFNPRRYIIKLLYKHIIVIIRTFIAGKGYKNILDYGCGSMPYKNLFLKVVDNYVGIDFSSNKNADLFFDANDAIPIDTKTSDIILSTQVLEHVEDPDLYLSECYKYLNKDGLLIISTHGYWLYHPHPTDYWRWTSAGLKKIISRNGFEIIYFKGLMSRAATGLNLFQDGIIFKLPKFLRPLFAFIMQILVSLFDKISRQETNDIDAAVYMIVARKI